MNDTEPKHLQETLPRYQQVKRYIAEKIDSGALRPGQRVASEQDLVKKFSLSRMTVSRALNELENEGLITRVKGVGSFVSENRSESALLEIHSIGDEIASQGHHHSCTVIHLAKSTAPRINALLGLEKTSIHFQSTLLHCSDDMPVQIEDRWVNPAFVPLYLEQDFTKTTPHDHLMSLGPLQAAEHVFEATVASRTEAEFLQVSENTACVVLKRRTWSLNVVASVAVITSPSKLRRYSGQFGTLPPRAHTIPRL